MDQNDSFNSTRQSPNGISTQSNSFSSIKSVESSDIIKCQYTIAVDLYKHEDNLNWNKLYNLFYVTSALLFILSFISRSDETFPNYINPLMLGIISAIGILVSFGFAITIWFGVSYLLERKNKVVEIEQELMKLGGISIVGGVGIFKMSPTIIILKYIPFAFVFSWFILLCYSIKQLF